MQIKVTTTALLNHTQGFTLKKIKNQAEGKQNPRQRQTIWNQVLVQKVDSEDEETTYGAQGRRFWAEEMYNDQTILERKKGRIKKNRKTVNPQPPKNNKVIEQNNVIVYLVILLILYK